MREKAMWYFLWVMTDGEGKEGEEERAEEYI
jgi:hypothetical protein